MRRGRWLVWVLDAIGLYNAPPGSCGGYGKGFRDDEFSKGEGKRNEDGDGEIRSGDEQGTLTRGNSKTAAAGSK